MKNKILIDTTKSMIECIFHAIVDVSGNYEFKIVVNDDGFKVINDNEKIDDFLLINTLMALVGTLSFDDLENELLDEQLELFIGIANRILDIRSECKNEEKA